MTRRLNFNTLSNYMDLNKTYFEEFTEVGNDGVTELANEGAYIRGSLYPTKYLIIKSVKWLLRNGSYKLSFRSSNYSTIYYTSPTLVVTSAPDEYTSVWDTFVFDSPQFLSPSNIYYINVATSDDSSVWFPRLTDYLYTHYLTHYQTGTNTGGSSFTSALPMQLSGFYLRSDFIPTISGTTTEVIV